MKERIILHIDMNAFLPVLSSRQSGPAGKTDCSHCAGGRT